VRYVDEFQARRRGWCEAKKGGGFHVIIGAELDHMQQSRIKIAGFEAGFRLLINIDQRSKNTSLGLIIYNKKLWHVY